MEDEAKPRSAKLHFIKPCNRLRVSRTRPVMRLLSSRTVDNYLVYRFALSRPWTAVTPQQIGASAAKLVGPASGVPAVLIQSAAR